MKLLLLITALVPIILVDGQLLVKHGDIRTCDVKYVKPGDDFRIRCQSDNAVLTRIYKPKDEVPSNETLTDISLSLSAAQAERTTTIKDYENATKEKDDGLYTCVVHHEPDHDPVFSTAQCRVIVVDLCEDSGCKENEICEPDYSTGTVECTCNYVCPGDWDILCSNTCELFPHECAMKEKICEDGIEREILNKGICPNTVEPKIRRVDQVIEAQLQEQVTLSSGLIEDGTPMVSIQWVFYPDDGPPTYLSARETYSFTADRDTTGTYRITLMHCMNETTAVYNEYRFAVIEPPTTGAPTTTQGIDDLTSPPGYTCSAFPGGVIDDFNAKAHYYDLSCTHVLAADLMPGGSYINPWFIYGTFDNHDGKTALQSMTFYLGRSIFEVQRGWLVHTGSDKFAFEEGVPQQVGESGCTVTYVYLHIKVDCAHFEGYYDGIMSGHIKLKQLTTDDLLQKGRGSIGLCFDNNSGWRPNWQVGRMQGRCEVDTEEPACQTDAPDDCQLSQPPQIFGKDWTSCGMGAESACNELNCDGSTPTPAQKCALERANRVNCNLKIGKSASGVDPACPDERCDWMKDVVSRGCPQENLPFVCP